MAEYVALLRDLNVGGNNIIKMTEPKACFEEMGFADVEAYIASGNMLFKASPDNPKRLTTATIEKRAIFRVTFYLVLLRCPTETAIAAVQTMLRWIAMRI